MILIKIIVAPEKQKMRIQIARKRKCGNLVFVMSVPPKNKRKKERKKSKARPSW